MDAALLRLARHRERKVEGGKLRQQRLRASSARGGQEKALHRGLCGAARRGSDLRVGGESARTRWSCGGARPPSFQDRRCTGLFRAAGAREVGLCPDEIEHTGQQETALWARWGAHRETRGRRRVGSALEWQERRERKKRERTRASGRRACEKEEREKEREK